MLARIRAAQKKYFDATIEGSESWSDSDSTIDSESAMPEGDLDSNRSAASGCESDYTDSLLNKIRRDSGDGRMNREKNNSRNDHLDRKARNLEPQDYDYPFQNVVFEGGGNKGIAYCGAVKVLEDLNLWSQIRRLAGASAGAMTACLLAVGFDSNELQNFLSQDLSQIFLDHRCGYCSLLPNLLTGFGWNPGKRIYDWFGQILQKQCGDPDITFREVLEKYDRELCIVVTNLNQMSTEYCHPKTTPDMAVRQAVRMSMAIPGLFRAQWYTNHGQTDVFVDGGVLCNYPIHCFDGWWLSMKPKDRFLKRLQPLDHLPRLLDKTERFGSFNETTLGFLLFADNEQELFRYDLEHMQYGPQLPNLPETKLANERQRKRNLQNKTDREHRRLVRAVNAFLRVLEKHNEDNNDTIDRAELEAALNDEREFKRKHRLHLFGDVDSETILQYLDRDSNGQISYEELVRFMEETGINIQMRFLGYQRLEVNTFFSFLYTLQNTLLHNVKKIFVEEHDIKRTVGINTGHVDTSDFVLEDADREFLVERGRRACEAFLRYFAAAKNLPKRQTASAAVITDNGSATSPCPITITDSNGITNVITTNNKSRADFNDGGGGGEADGPNDVGNSRRSREGNIVFRSNSCAGFGSRKYNEGCAPNSDSETETDDVTNTDGKAVAGIRAPLVDHDA